MNKAIVMSCVVACVVGCEPEPGEGNLGGGGSGSETAGQATGVTGTGTGMGLGTGLGTDTGAGTGLGTGTGTGGDQAANLLVNGAFADGTMTSWTLERIAPATAEGEIVADGPNGMNAVKITTTAIDPTDMYGWHVQFYQPVMIEAGKSYSLTFWAKSDQVGEIAVTCMQNHEPFEHHTAELYPTITTEWVQYVMPFTFLQSDPLMRINFGNLAQNVGQSWWFADAVLTSN